MAVPIVLPAFDVRERAQFRSPVCCEYVMAGKKQKAVKKTTPWLRIEGEFRADMDTILRKEIDFSVVKVRR
jgi:hypothetical protein